MCKRSHFVPLLVAALLVFAGYANAKLYDKTRGFQVRTHEHGCKTWLSYAWSAEPCIPLCFCNIATGVPFLQALGISPEDTAEYAKQHDPHHIIHKHMHREGLKEHPEVKRFLEWRQMHKVRDLLETRWDAMPAVPW